MVALVAQVPARPTDTHAGDGGFTHRSGVDRELDQLVPDARAFACLDADVARRASVVPLSVDGIDSSGRVTRMTLACLDPGDLPVCDRVRRALPPGMHVRWRTASLRAVIGALDRCYGVGQEIENSVLRCENENSETPVSATVRSEQAHDQDSPVARLVDALLADALAREASDIHVSPEEACVVVRYRIDGVLVEARRLERRYQDALTVRIKVLAGADIAETRQPQDGRFSRHVSGRRVEFRLSCFPLHTGENLVLRVLQRGVAAPALADFMQPADVQLALSRLVHRPHGLIVVSGPTGSGKTTTLYALLGSRDLTTLNVMTLEDPVEHPMSGVRQTSIDPARGLDYAAGVRALLRQDPDILLMGEVRDAHSCAMALRAAMTGHLVLTTVHAADASSVIGRLCELGAEPGVLADVLIGVIAQRLVRTVCTACCGEHVITLDAARGEHASCPLCSDSGLRGRRAVMEVLVPDQELAAVMRQRTDAQVVNDLLRQQGHCDLRTRAEALVAAGVTTRSEIERVFGTHAHHPP